MTDKINIYASFISGQVAKEVKFGNVQIKEDIEQVDEISTAAKKAYVNASKDDQMAMVVGDKKRTDRAMDNRLAGQKRAEKSMKEEAEEIDEISQNTAMNYSIKANKEISGNKSSKVNQRYAGVKMADDKLRKMQNKSSGAKVATSEDIEALRAQLVKSLEENTISSSDIRSIIDLIDSIED